ncbi:phage integrase N-terminal SAM-like domain-containing protein [Vibrio fluvialis]|nr:phage integrase N-terminal SAM-like domain-containing protein [Vibrio fluvialis]
MSLKSPFLIGVQETMRMRGYSIRTEKTYLYWIKAFINFHHKRHPRNNGNGRSYTIFNLPCQPTECGNQHSKNCT